MKMEGIREQLGQLEALLREELKCARQAPGSASEDLEAAGELIESLKAELTQQGNAYEALKKEIASFKAELAKTNSVPAASYAELDNERRRRIRAEEELSAYRRQSKCNNSENNAKRIAISLARHCVELTQELERLRRGDPAAIPHEARQDALKAIIFPKEATPKAHVMAQPAKAPVPVSAKGWGTLDDDDDLFSALN
jgi:chromosome segregation ATPase